MISRPILSPVIAKINQERVGTESLSEGREDGEQSRRPVRRDASRATEGQPADVCGSLRLQAGSGYFGGSRGGAEEVSDQSCFLLWIKLIEFIPLLPLQILWLPGQESPPLPSHQTRTEYAPFRKSPSNGPGNGTKSGASATIVASTVYARLPNAAEGQWQWQQ